MGGAHRALNLLTKAPIAISAPDEGHCHRPLSYAALPLLQSVSRGACSSRAEAPGQPRAGRGSAALPPAPGGPRTGISRPAQHAWSCVSCCLRPSGGEGSGRRCCCCSHVWPSLSGGSRAQSERGPPRVSERKPCGRFLATLASPGALPAPRCGRKAGGGGCVQETPEAPSASRLVQ